MTFLQQLRKERGYTQEDLSKLSGISIATIQKIESKKGSTQDFSVTTAMALAKALNVKVEKLFKRKKIDVSFEIKNIAVVKSDRKSDNMLMCIDLESLYEKVCNKFGEEKGTELCKNWDKDANKNLFRVVPEETMIFFEENYQAIVEFLGTDFESYSFVRHLNYDEGDWMPLFKDDKHGLEISKAECIKRLLKTDDYEFEIYNADNVSDKINELIISQAKNIIQERIEELQSLMSKKWNKFEWR